MPESADTSAEFFAKSGAVVIVGGIVLWLVISLSRLLPGTTKYTRQ